MPLKVTNAGEIRLITHMIVDSARTLTVRLYQNDYTPVDNSAASNFTESTFGGYTSRTLVPGSWNTATTNASGKAEIRYSSDLTWAATSTQTVHGYYVLDSTGTVLWAERFAQPRALIDGDSLSLSPAFTLKSEF